MRNIQGKFWTVLCVPALLIVILTGVMMVTGIKPAIVLSGSMEPEISTGSLVFISTGYRNVSEGDVVAFETGGAMVTHRLVTKAEDGWITKGDANEEADPWRVSDERIVGKVCVWIPGAGYAVSRVKNFTAAVLRPAAGLI